MNYAHPKDSRKLSYKLPLGAVLFLVVIIIGFATTTEPEYNYLIDTSDMLEIIQAEEAIITPMDARKLISNPSTDFQFIDLRNPHDFLIGHIEGAINVPAHNVLDQSYKAVLNAESTTNILYANSQDEACSAWMLIRQLGYQNNKILLGGYTYMKSSETDSLGLYYNEKAKYDFAKIVKETAGSGSIGSDAAGPKKVIKKKKKKKGAQGGC